VIFTANKYIYNLLFLSTNFSGFIFFAYLVLHIRFKIALPLTLVYSVLLQISLIYFKMYTEAEFLSASIGIWIMFPIGAFAGYFFEKSSRENYTQKQIISKQRDEIKKEREKSEALLLNILPEEIAERLKKGENIIADKIDEASILFADIVGFTALSSRLSAEAVVSFLNDLFQIYDNLVDKRRKSNCLCRRYAERNSEIQQHPNW
jgi:hypothetical protein